ncbi:MAG TPA: EamA family transporter [Woeseiaceae bacterium]|nr:EamA family transporter [Woeseiaceae bacterium]
MTAGFVDNWVFLSLFAAAAWGLSCVIDVGFVSAGVYRVPSDGVMVAGLFCLLPLFVMAQFANALDLDFLLVGVGLLSGLAFLLHIYLYFKALFFLRDAVNAEIFNALSVLFVPTFAFIFLGERLSGLHYAAIAIAVAGIIVLIGFQVARLSWQVVACLLASVIAASLMMVMQAWVLQRTNYASAVCMFSFSAFATSLIMVGVQKERRHRVAKMFRQFVPLFVAVQLLEVLAVLASQRATKSGPSVSFVALLESTLPLFVLVFSWVSALAVKYWLPLRFIQLRSTLKLQTVATPSKVLSMLLIVVAIVMVQ